MNNPTTALHVRVLLSAAMMGSMLLAGGCEVESFFDPSKPVYMQHTPTTAPILERLDIIERGESQWANATEVQPEDLLPSTLEYRLAPGDVVTAEIFELILPGQFAIQTRRVNQSGNIRLPTPLRDFPAAGLTLLELEDAIVDFLDPDYIRDPIVTVSLDQGQGLVYTMEGNIPRPSIYQIARPDLRLNEALALAGGAPATTKVIYIIRSVSISSEYDLFQNRGRATPTDVETDNQGTAPVDIDDLIEDIEGDGGTSPGVLQEPTGIRETMLGGNDASIRRVSNEPLLDIDDFNTSPMRIRSGRTEATTSFIYVQERDAWIPVNEVLAQDGSIVDEIIAGGGVEPVLERIIKIPFRKSLSDNSYNIVIRPGDRVFISPPQFGVVYIGGEIARPGVYQMPVVGRLTLSQLITAAGGFGPLAIPSRVDFTRRVGDNREATVRLNLGAIRHKTEPDIFLKPDDHILIGTNWLASPLAVIRNGFRATYGFGFLLDRNFGNDVFGSPPRSFN